MTKIRKNVIGAIMCLVMLLVGVCALTACGSKDNASVKFMVQNDNGAWEQYYVSDAKDGKVTMPQNPEKTNYVFRDWYDYSSDPVVFRNEGITSSKTVYAYFVPAEVKISLNGNDSETAKLESLETYTYKYTAEAFKDNLSFDGWYTDQNYTVKYETGADVTELYARFLAHVVFNDGYKTLYEVDIPLGKKLTAPDEVVGKDANNNDVTFEEKTICQTYMDPVSISYVCDGNNVDFTKDVTGNMSIKVRWQSPGLMFEKDSDSGNYYLSYVDSSAAGVSEAPVVSILSTNAVVDQEKSGDEVTLTYGTVTGTLTETLGNAFPMARKVIFDEGIQWISLFNGTANSNIEEVVFPSTLKVLEKSLNVMPRLKEVSIPSSVVSVLDCFWADYETNGDLKGPKSEKTYDINVTLPATVTNIVRLPKNVKFAEKSPFTRDEADNRIYKIEGRKKILVSDYTDNIKDGILSVPEGVTGIQVGLYQAMTFDTLKLPNTLATVSFNASVNIVPGYYNATKNKGGLLYRPNDVPAGSSDTTRDPARANAGADWYSIVSTLGNRISRVEYNRTSIKSALNKNYYYVNATSYASSDTTYYDNMDSYPVVCTQEVATGKKATVKVRAYSEMTGFEKVTSFTIKSGEALTQEVFDAKLGLDVLSYTYRITSLTELDNDYELGQIVSRNLYITMTFDYALFGVDFEENSDGTLTVKNFNVDKAQLVPGENALYIVNIPESVDGKPVVAIKENAFKGERRIAEVYIKNSVKTIGASAFEGTENLRKVIIEKGGLETIGKNAFLNAGCYLDPTTKEYVVSNETGIEFLLPLSNIKEIAPYALKTKAIKEFTPVKGEEQRYLLSYPWMGPWPYEGAKAGDFFFVCNNYGKNYGIVKYMGSEVVDKENVSGGKTAVTVLDVQYVATAGGFLGGAGTLAIGKSLRAYVSMDAAADKYVMRYEMMEGSVYYLAYNDEGRAFNEISFGIVKKIHTNAFTDMQLSVMSYYGNDDILDSWITRDQIVNQDSSIFEEGWWQGTKNSVMREKLANDLKKNTDSTL